MDRRRSRLIESLSAARPASEGSASAAVTDWKPVRRNADIATSASAQISDSWTSPPLSKVPTTVQSLSRNAMREPTPSPANCRAALWPTITSRTPRPNGRPSTIRTSSRMVKAAGCTPRNGTLLGSVWPWRGSSTITNSSADTSGCPAASRARAGRLASTVAWSRPTPLDISASEPARSMITRVGRPVLASVCRKPSPMASTETRTPTTPAIPTTTTSEVPRRCGMFLRLMSVIWTTWFSQGIASPVSRERVHDAQAVHPQRRRQPDRDGQPERHGGGPEPGAGLHEEGREAPAGGAVQDGEHADRGEHAEAGADDEEQCRLAEHERRHGGVGEAEGLEDGQLRHPLADRLRDRVAGQDQDREEHGDQDARDQRAHVADLPGEAEGEFLLGRRLRLVGRIRERAVDVRRDGLGLIDVRDADDVPARLALPELARLVEVGDVDEHDLGVRAHRRILGIEDADELELVVHVQVAGGVDGEDGERVALVLVLGAEPVGVGDAHHARHALDPRRVGHRQRLDDGVARGGEQSLGVRGVGTRVECHLHGLAQAEEQEGDEDRQHREHGARLLAEELRPEQRQIPHDGSWPFVEASVPLSRRSRRRAYSAAFGSWVTMTMVLPWSSLSIWSSSMISCAVARSRSPVGSSQTRSVGSETMARAMATRCSWPPESSLGLCLARSRRPTSVSAISACRRRSAALRLVSSSGSSTLRWAESTGSRL